MARHPRLRERPHRPRAEQPAAKLSPRERLLAARAKHPGVSDYKLAKLAEVLPGSAHRWLREVRAREAAEREAAEREAAPLVVEPAATGAAGVVEQSSAVPTRSGIDPLWVPDETGVPPALGGRHPQRSGRDDPVVGHPYDRGLAGHRQLLR